MADPDAIRFHTTDQRNTLTLPRHRYRVVDGHLVQWAQRRPGRGRECEHGGHLFLTDQEVPHALIDELPSDIATILRRAE